MLRYAGLLLLAGLSSVQAETLFSTLPNGMKVLIKEDTRAPVAAVRLWYKVGSVDEHEGKTGLSHALEHMMFKGTDSVPEGEFSRRVAALGGDDNAYTNRTETVYTTNIAVKNLDEVLKMEADRMVNLNFSDKAFDNEMDVIREERRMRTDDSPEGKMWETLNIKMWDKPFNKAPIIGYMNDLHTLKADDLRAWYKQWYAPCPKPAKFVWGKYENGILTVYGKAPSSCLGKEVYVNMFDAQDFARRSFINQWRHGGNSISDGLAVGPVPPQARTLARIRSKPLRDVLADMNKHSNNIIARTVFLTLGERATADKARQNPEAAVRSRLALSGIPTAPLVLENGSGLSRRERVSARMMGDMLAAAYRSPFKQAFIGSLPIAGRDGTLKSRFKNIGAPLRLKTGTLKNVRALAGYYLGGNGSDPLAVVVIINSERADKLLGEMDKLTERLIAPAPPSDGLTPGAANP